MWCFSWLMKYKTGTVTRDNNSEATSPAINEIASP
jgi:hypothetical protein